MNRKESIFKDAYFGKLYKTRDERKAIYLFVRNMYEENKSYFNKNDIWHFLVIEGQHSYTPCYANGTVVGLPDSCKDEIIPYVNTEERKMYWKARKAFCKTTCGECPLHTDDIEGGGGTVVQCDKLEMFDKILRGE